MVVSRSRSLLLQSENGERWLLEEGKLDEERANGIKIQGAVLGSCKWLLGKSNLWINSRLSLKVLHSVDRTLKEEVPALPWVSPGQEISVEECYPK